ncbi:hypothetical protein [Helicobacter pametensis]|uniref:hypothetical protein n=1 Tax=Helicobacter pametensis TaxID=95149 RepID=UPI0004B2F8FB|nr:hypothetical protein [Helicobacter pametensis]
MNFSDLMIGVAIGVVGYKLGEMIQKIRQERDDSEYGLGDFVSEALEGIVDGQNLDKRF